MNPLTHGMLSWSIAHRVCGSRRDAAIVTIAGMIPDLDGIGLIVDVVRDTLDSSDSLYCRWHHVLGHNLVAAVGFAVLAFAVARERWRTAGLALALFHLHLFCDLIGSRGPDGHQWPIPYLQPFSSSPELVWSGQWALDAWPNVLLTVILLVDLLRQSYRLGWSPLWYCSRRADAALVQTLRHRFAGDQKEGGTDLG